MAELPEATCGDCISFTAEDFDDQERILGSCRFRPELGLIPESLRWCDSFQVSSSSRGKVQIPVPSAPAKGSRHSRPTAAKVVRATLSRPVIGNTEGEISVDRDGLKQVIREILEEESLYGYPELGRKWHDGELVMKPGNPDLQPKTVPIDAFFHKIVMVRDRLRVLEAKVNANSKLAEADKVELQQYISRIYGSLTSFNVLFEDRGDHFKSS